MEIMGTAPTYETQDPGEIEDLLLRILLEKQLLEAQLAFMGVSALAGMVANSLEENPSIN